MNSLAMNNRHIKKKEISAFCRHWLLLKMTVRFLINAKFPFCLFCVYIVTLDRDKHYDGIDIFSLVNAID